ncbi:S8 family serine peptidase [Terasakiella sp. A23]|uniref:S8 family serine peptidase n=1 Tax=Terasakiella sp. FCG-A23 TaxID=3080561 RepID=UPI00295404DB|nr:S8 family serine peptidase [Terasakiella sp. A23]MDV7338228.1 S8 family serine peptidase [Terasakiella sp. A23]
MKHALLKSTLALSCALLVSNCTSLPDDHSILSHDNHPMDHDELIVLDPPKDYVRHLGDLGLEVVEVHKLESVGETLYHLRITDGAHPYEGRDKHKEKFPDVLVDAHHLYEHQARKVDKSYTARKAAKWNKESRTCSNGIQIGMIDGFVDTSHPAFNGTKITTKNFFYKGKQTANTGHGTAVASVMAGHAPYSGVLPGAEIVAANVFHAGSKGKPIGGTISIMRAIDWLVSQNVPIINMSIGGSKNALIQRAIKHADEKGIIVVGSAGNSGPFSKKINYPSAYPSVIAITAVDRDNRNARFATAGKYIDFATPGVNIWTAHLKKGGKAMSGTSFAAPIFTAYAAAAMQHHKVKSTNDIKSYFKKYAKDTAEIGHDKYTGWGVVLVPPICGK